MSCRRQGGYSHYGLGGLLPCGKSKPRSAMQGKFSTFCSGSLKLVAPASGQARACRVRLAGCLRVQDLNSGCLQQWQHFCRRSSRFVQGSLLSGKGYRIRTLSRTLTLSQISCCSLFNFALGLLTCTRPALLAVKWPLRLRVCLAGLGTSRAPWPCKSPAAQSCRSHLDCSKILAYGRTKA